MNSKILHIYGSVGQCLGIYFPLLPCNVCPVRLLRLADMETPSMDERYFYITQTEVRFFKCLEVTGDAEELSLGVKLLLKDHCSSEYDTDSNPEDTNSEDEE